MNSIVHVGKDMGAELELIVLNIIIILWFLHTERMRVQSKAKFQTAKYTFFVILETAGIRNSRKKVSTFAQNPSSPGSVTGFIEHLAKEQWNQQIGMLRMGRNFVDRTNKFYLQQWRIQDFSEECANLGGGANILFGQFFPKTAWKWRNFGPGGTYPSRLLDPSLCSNSSGILSGYCFRVHFGKIKKSTCR